MYKLILLIIFSYTLKAQEVSYVCGAVNKTLTIVCNNCTGGTTYQWTSPSNVVSTSQSVNATEAGIWLWSITSNGCAAITGTHTINQELQPNVSINAVDGCINSDQTISASGVPSGYTYSWNFGQDSSPATSNNSSELVSYSTTGSKTISLDISKVLPTGACTNTCVWNYSQSITIGNISGTSTCN